jgi:hypothetical protein
MPTLPRCCRSNRHGILLVIRKFALLIMGACCIWTALVHDGVAQPAASDWRGRCTTWYRLSLDPGSRRIVFPYVVDTGIQLQGETIQTSEEPAISGVFRARGAFTIAIWGDPDSEETSSLEFTTPVNVQLEFLSYDGKTKRSVTEGRLFNLPSPLLPGLVCPNDAKPPPGTASPRRPSVVIKRIEGRGAKRSEESEEKTIDELKKKYGIGSEPAETGKRAKNFNELAQEVTRAPESIPAEPPSVKPADPPPGKPAVGEPAPGITGNGDSPRCALGASIGLQDR